MAGAWITEDDCNIASDQNTLWYNKWTHNTAVADESLIILYLAQTVVQNLGKDDNGSISMHADCQVVCEMLTVDRLKYSQYALDGGSIISRIKFKGTIKFSLSMHT